MKYLLIVVTFLSCNNNIPLNKETRTISTEPLNIIQAVPPTSGTSPALFEAAFIKGASLNEKKTQYNFYGVTIGHIKISSGYIIACDPMHIDEYGKPFTQVFPTGEFPVQLSIVNLGDREEIAFSRILFSSASVVKWEFALLKGQQPLPVGGEEMHGYSVDAGVGIFIDEAANKLLDFETTSQNSDGMLYKEMDKHYRNDWRYALYSFGDHNMAAFTSGQGDGYYATYIGFDAQGKPCRLLTDFGFFDWKRIKKRIL